LSRSEFHEIAEHLAAVVDQVLSDHDTIDEADLATTLAAATRLYSNCAPNPYASAMLRQLEVSPTEACTVAATLLRAQSLTPFEFSVWFSSGRTDTSTGSTTLR